MMMAPSSTFPANACSAWSMRCRLLLGAVSLSLSVLVYTPDLSGQENAEAVKAEAPNVTLVTGTGRSTSARLADDIRTVMFEKTDFRLMPVIGNGDLNTIDGLLAYDLADLAFVNLDNLNYIASTGIYDDIQEKISYITRTHNEEVHLLVGSHIKNIEMLAGAKVNVGPNKQSTYITASEIFASYSIEPVLLTESHTMAYQMLKEGKLDAMMIVDGTPSEYLRLASLDDGVRLLDVPIEPLSDVYVLSDIANADYPKLFATGDKVETVSVPTLLIAYSWPEESDRQNSLDEFIDAFFEALPKLQARENGFHPKWQDIDMSSPLPGDWQRVQHSLEFAKPLN